MTFLPTRQLVNIHHRHQNEKHLVYITDHNRGEEDLCQGGCHGVHGDDHGWVHEVNGIAVQEGGSPAHSDEHYSSPEDVLKTWKNTYPR